LRVLGVPLWPRHVTPSLAICEELQRITGIKEIDLSELLERASDE
jgi:hypothetical protein